MRTRLNKTSICSILCVDIVGHSRRPDAEQIMQKERFNALVEASLEGVPKNDRAILDTGDGVLIAFFGAPEDALTVALLIRDGIVEDSSQHPQHPIALRTGINLGPVRVVPDINGALNIVGDGLNAAQQVMSFSAPDRILVSRSYYEIVSPENPDILRMLSYFGIKIDKDEREHEMYIVDLVGSKEGAGWLEVLAKFVPADATPVFWLSAGVFGLLFCLVVGAMRMYSGEEAVSNEVPLAAAVESVVPLEPAPEKKEITAQVEHRKRKTAGNAPEQLPHAQEPESARETASASCTEAARVLTQCH
ncbi:MAG TPA: hypothetical protein VK959_02265 [Methylophilaceae bacterium]|jgi:hypothetical protein|nr:hypothetical protein [Methylophilaceae bacterium]